VIAPGIAALLAASWMSSAIVFAWWRGGQRPDQLRRMSRDGALVLDVCTPEQYATGHADGAINIPVDELTLRQSEIGTHERAVLVYGPSVMLAALAAEKLRTLGFHTIVSAGTLTRYREQLIDA
jgi:rhodanese-related sulfurtransferase